MLRAFYCNVPNCQVMNLAQHFLAYVGASAHQCFNCNALQRWTSKLRCLKASAVVKHEFLHISATPRKGQRTDTSQCHRQDQAICGQHMCIATIHGSVPSPTVNLIAICQCTLQADRSQRSVRSSNKDACMGRSEPKYGLPIMNTIVSSCKSFEGC